MQAVATAAGSSVGAIQLHFGTKSGLLLAVYAEQVAEEHDRINSILTSLAGEADRARVFVERVWEGYSQDRVSFQLALERHARNDAELGSGVVDLLEQHAVPTEMFKVAFGADTPELRASYSAVMAALAGLAGFRPLLPAHEVKAMLPRIVVMARAVLHGSA